MRRLSIILFILGIAMVLLGLAINYKNYKCDVIDKNTDFWVRNCDYND